MKKEKKEQSPAQVIASAIIIIGIFVGISYLWMKSWYGLFLVAAVGCIWGICFSKIYTVVTKKKIKIENTSFLAVIALFLCGVIASFTNSIVALAIYCLPIEACALWIVWKMIVVVLESLGILYTDAYDDKKK